MGRGGPFGGVRQDAPLIRVLMTAMKQNTVDDDSCRQVQSVAAYVDGLAFQGNGLV